MGSNPIGGLFKWWTKWENGCMWCCAQCSSIVMHGISYSAGLVSSMWFAYMSDYEIKIRACEGLRKNYSCFVLEDPFANPRSVCDLLPCEGLLLVLASTVQHVASKSFFEARWLPLRFYRFVNLEGPRHDMIYWGGNAFPMKTIQQEHGKWLRGHT